MEIPDDTWAYAWGLLSERFEEQAQPIRDLYRRHLEAHLDSVDEFERAVYVVLTTERFLPPPHDFVEAVHGDRVEREALDAWRGVRAAIGSSRTVGLTEIGVAGQDALASVGGLNAIGQTTRGELRHVRREFLEAFKAYSLTRQEKAALPVAVGSLELLPEEGTHAEP